MNRSKHLPFVTSPDIELVSEQFYHEIDENEVQSSKKKMQIPILKTNTEAIEQLRQTFLEMNRSTHHPFVTSPVTTTVLDPTEEENTKLDIVKRIENFPMSQNIIAPCEKRESNISLSEGIDVNSQPYINDLQINPITDLNAIPKRIDKTRVTPDPLSVSEIQLYEAFFLPKEETSELVSSDQCTVMGKLKPSAGNHETRSCTDDDPRHKKQQRLSQNGIDTIVSEPFYHEVDEKELLSSEKRVQIPILKTNTETIEQLRQTFLEMNHSTHHPFVTSSVTTAILDPIQEENTKLDTIKNTENFPTSQNIIAPCKKRESNILLFEGIDVNSKPYINDLETNPISDLNAIPKRIDETRFTPDPLSVSEIQLYEYIFPPKEENTDLVSSDRCTAMRTVKFPSGYHETRTCTEDDTRHEKLQRLSQNGEDAIVSEPVYHEIDEKEIQCSEKSMQIPILKTNTEAIEQLRQTFLEMNHSTHHTFVTSPVTKCSATVLNPTAEENTELCTIKRTENSSMRQNIICTISASCEKHESNMSLSEGIDINFEPYINDLEITPIPDLSAIPKRVNERSITPDPLSVSEIQLYESIFTPKEENTDLVSSDQSTVLGKLKYSTSNHETGYCTEDDPRDEKLQRLSQNGNDTIISEPFYHEIDENEIQSLKKSKQIPLLKTNTEAIEQLRKTFFEMNISKHHKSVNLPDLKCSLTVSAPTVKENSVLNSIKRTTNLSTSQNSIRTSPNRSLEYLSNEKAFSGDINNTADSLNEIIDEIDATNQMKLKILNATRNKQTRQGFNEYGTVLEETKECNLTRYERDKKHESRDINPESEESKDDLAEKYERDDEGNTLIDQIWMNYTERPLLPLKPYQKQKSRSYSNLLQTIKGFAVRKTSANKRYSSPEFEGNTFADKSERCTSEANISNDYRTKDSRIEDQMVRRVCDTEEFLAKKNFAWYHQIDAREASKRLLTMRQNGAFLIRPASNPTNEIFHTLCVVFSGRVYNFHVRNLKNGRICLGKRQETFSSLLEMIKYHQNVPISIYHAESVQMGLVHLLITPSK